jgi:hypothetical protein
MLELRNILLHTDIGDPLSLVCAYPCPGLASGSAQYLVAQWQIWI